MLPYNVPKSSSSSSLTGLVKNLSSGNLSGLVGGSTTTEAPKKPQEPLALPAQSLLPFGRHVPTPALQKLNDAAAVLKK